MKLNWQGLLTASLLISVTGLSHSSLAENLSKQNLTVKNCHVKGIRQQVQCGTYSTPENYAKPDGVKIDINFVVLPAIDNSNEKLPLMFLAGGPGQAASELAGQIYSGFNEIRKTHDLLLIDQRGTGKSQPLQCQDSLEIDPYTSIPEDFSGSELVHSVTWVSGTVSGNKR